MSMLNVPQPIWSDQLQANWQLLQMVLEDVPQKLTRRDILDEWPDDFVKPDRATLWRWLDRALKLNRVACEGTGRKNEPFRYWLPASEQLRMQDPLYRYTEEERINHGSPFRSLREAKKLAD